MECLRDAWDAGFEITFRDVRVRSLGKRETPREIAQKACDEFNARFRVGETVKCYPVIPPSFRDEDHVRVLVILDPGAYVMASGAPVVATRGGAWAIEAVLPNRFSDGVSDEQKEAVIANDLRRRREWGTGHCDACHFAGRLYRVGPLALCALCFEKERAKGGK